MKNKIKHIAIGFVVSSAILLSGCSQDTPLSALTSNNLSNKYDKNFWASEQKQNSTLWQQAKVTCKSLSTPNCSVIGALERDAFFQ